jgi:hypothetical protein
MSDPRAPKKVADDQRDSSDLNNPASGPGVVGDFGPGSDELLIDGQEETFSRSEVERGRPEHQSNAGDGEAQPSPDPKP